MIARHTEKQENMAQTKEENKSPETNTEDSYIYTSPNTEFNVTFLSYFIFKLYNIVLVLPNI